MRFKRALTVLLLLLATAACTGPTPKVTHYLLPAPETTPAPPQGTAFNLRLQPLRLASYLDGDGLLLQLDAITLNRARHHRWAEALDHQLERGLRQRLAQRLPDARILDARNGTGAAPTLRLQLTVDRFLGLADGTALASGHWQLSDAEGTLVATGPFRAQAPLQSDGYGALVRALGQSWDAVADQVAAAIRKHRPQEAQHP